MRNRVRRTEKEAKEESQYRLSGPQMPKYAIFFCYGDMHNVIDRTQISDNTPTVACSVASTGNFPAGGGEWQGPL